MSDSLPENTKAAPSQPDLSTEAHYQIMDYLRLADRSKNPAIAAAAVKLAQERQRQQGRLHAKISPALAVSLATLIAIAAVAACWYALVHHPGGIGFALVLVVITIAAFVICLYALSSGNLSESNFMAAVQWVGDRLKQIYPGSSNGDSGHSITASNDEQPPQSGKE